jgi:hypothetical protein
MQKQFPVGFKTKHDLEMEALGQIKILDPTLQPWWISPEDFLKRVENGDEMPVNEVTTHRKIIPQLCEYVCRFWNETLYTPSVTIDEATTMPTDEQLDTMLEKHVYRQSLG